MSLDSRSPEAGGDDRRSRRIRTVDYSKPGSEAPFSVPSMSGMAGRSLYFTSIFQNPTYIALRMRMT